MDVLQKLSNADLLALAAAIRSGRLDSPVTDISVRRFYRGPHVLEVVYCFERLAFEGMSVRHLALVLETIVSTRDQKNTPDDLVELVWTGPEPDGVSNRDTGVVVRELFATAVAEVLIAGFAVYQGKAIFQLLAERMHQLPNLRVQLFLDIHRPRGDISTSSELVWKFLSRFRNVEWPGERLPELYYDPRSLSEDQLKRSSMHAKCVVIDRQISFVTSANFTEAAQTRNVEVGVLIKSTTFSEGLCFHFDRLLESGAAIAIPSV